MLEGSSADADGQDVDPVRAVSVGEIKAAARRPDNPDLVAEHLVARCSGNNQHALRTIAADHIRVLGLDAAYRRVGRAEHDPFLVLPSPASSTVVRRRQGDSRRRINRVGQILADRVALNQVTHIGWVWHRDADAKRLDGQSTDDAL